MRNILDWIEEKKQQYEGHEPRTMAQGGGVIGKPGGLVEPGVEYYGKWKKHAKDNANVKKWKKLYPNQDFNKLRSNQQSRIRVHGGMNTGQGMKVKKIDKDVLKSIVEKANNSDKWYSREGISKLYAEEMGHTNVTKRKTYGAKGKFVTYSLLGDGYVKDAGGLTSQEAKIERVFKDILSMDGPVPEVDLKIKRGMTNYKKYLVSKTGLGSATIERTLPTLPDYKNNIEEFKYLGKSKLSQTDLAHMSLSDQLIFAVDAAEGKPIFTGMKNLTKDPNLTVMKIAQTSWNRNKGQGSVQFYNKNGKPITWKHGLELNVNDVSFSEGKSKKRFGIGDKKGTMNLRFEGKKYFPEVYENQKYINELKTTMVDNPFRGKKQIPFGELMKKVYMQGHKWDAKAPLFSIFHGPEGIAKKPFTDLSFGMHELNKALYDIDRIPLKGLKQKVIKQALVGLEGKKGGDLLEAIVAKHSEHASQVAGGQKFDKPLRVRVFEEVAKTGDLGSKESKYLQSQIEKVFKQKGIKVSNAQKGAISMDLLKDIGKLGPKGLRLLASDWVWPEIVIGWLDKQNNIQKGMSPERASSEMWKSVTFGLRDKGGTENAILGQLKKLGYGEKDIKAAEHMMRYGKLSKEIEKTERGIESMELGLAEQGSAEGAQQLREKLENLKKEQESVAGFYFGAIGDKDANYGYELYDQASKELMRTEWNRSLEGRKKRTDPYAGQMGSEFQEIFAMTPDWSETKEKIAAMSPEELDKWNLQERGIGYERVHPMYGAAMSDKQMEPLKEQMDYMYAGGGMVGIRKPSAIAPTGGPMHQGLRSLYINDKDY